MFPLIAENLLVEFNGKHILGPLDLTVNKGDISLILGPNGSGKTTLLKSLHGIMKLKRGSIKWSCSNNSSMKKQMFVFQTPIMLRRSVFENLTYPLLLRKVSNSKAHRLATEWVEKIGLNEIMHISATRLSGGEKQRLSIARAILKAIETKNNEGKIYELGGGKVISFGDMIKLILSTIGKKRIVADVPMTLAKIQSSLLGLLPIDPIITKDQCLILSEKDNVVSGDHLTLKDLNIKPTDIEKEMEKWLWRYRSGGEFAKV